MKKFQACLIHFAIIIKKAKPKYTKIVMLPNIEIPKQMNTFHNILSWEFYFKISHTQKKKLELDSYSISHQNKITNQSPVAAIFTSYLFPKI